MDRLSASLEESSTLHDHPLEDGKSRRVVVRGHTFRELRVGDYPLLALEPVQPVPSLADLYVPVRQDARTESGQGSKPIAWPICAQKLSAGMASHERLRLLTYGGARIGCERTRRSGVVVGALLNVDGARRTHHVEYVSRMAN